MAKSNTNNKMGNNTPRILYEDSSIIVCYKPHGLAVQHKNPAVPDLERYLLNHLAASGPLKTGKTVSHSQKPPYLAVIHRLDQPVAGLLVFAKTPKAAKALNKQLNSDSFGEGFGKGFGKYYLAVTEGIPAEPEGTLTDYLVKDGRTNTSRICEKDTPGAKQARLSYQVIEEDADNLCKTIFGVSLATPAPSETSPISNVSSVPHALLEVTLDTGRHHQIRVQLANMGCPIVGDTKYNKKASATKGWQTLLLCAYKLSFRHPETGKPMMFSLISL